MFDKEKEKQRGGERAAPPQRETERPDGKEKEEKRDEVRKKRRGKGAIVGECINS